MKTSFRSDEIAHAWFHARSGRGKSPGNASFEGNAFYSYATVIGRKLEHKGKTAVLINDTSFSVSTSKVFGRMRCAIPHGTTLFHVSEGMGARLNHSPIQIFDYAVEQSAERLAKASATKHNGYKARMEGEAGYWLDEARKVAEFFGLRRKVDEKTAQRLAAAKAREEKARAKREAQQAEARRILAQNDYDAWKRGEEVSRSYFHDFPVAFRVEGEELVSSLGARVSLKAAKRALRFVKKHEGEEWRENGEQCPVDSYRVQSISPVGIVAGCHRISWDEVRRVESLLA